jgi:hypothetical protein
MSDADATESPVVDGVTEDTRLPPPPPVDIVVQAEVLPEIVMHRIGGHAGVRVTQTGVAGAGSVKRVTGLNDHTDAVTFSRDSIAAIRMLAATTPESVDHAVAVLEQIASLLPAVD